MTDDRSPRRLRRHRQFGLGLVPLAVVLVVAGAILTPKDGLVGLLGLVALAQGIGLAVASVSLLLGHNPLGQSGQRQGRA